jgi:hypothetical protein
LGDGLGDCQSLGMWERVNVAGCRWYPLVLCQLEGSMSKKPAYGSAGVAGYVKIIIVESTGLC